MELVLVLAVEFRSHHGGLGVMSVERSDPTITIVDRTSTSFRINSSPTAYLETPLVSSQGATNTGRLFLARLFLPY